MGPFELLLVVNLAATLYMVGLIWVVQLVHYPLFELVGELHFREYQQRHRQSISVVVGMPMFVEAVSSVGLFWFSPSKYDFWLATAGVLLLAIIWVSTICLQVPCHSRLTSGFDAAVHRRLVGTNWIRTVAWTLRGSLMIYLLVNLISRSV